MSTKRNLPDCPIFRDSRDLSKTVVPTYVDAMKCYLHKRQIIKMTSYKDPSVSKISKVIVMKIKDLWIKGSIPCVSANRITRMISDYHANIETY